MLRKLDLIGKIQNYFSEYNLVYAQNHLIEIFERPEISPLWKSKIYEQETTQFAREYVSPGDCVYDVGANIGYFSLEFARLVGENGTVESFEPHPHIFRVLERNIKRNGYKNIQLNNVACGELTSVKRLYFSTENEGNHKVIQNPNSNESVEVQMIALADKIHSMPPKLIKMDIEGCELLALKGIGEELLKQCNIDFIIEFHPYEMSFFNIEGHEILDLFSLHGYGFRNLAYGNFPIIVKADILKNYRKEEFGITNLFCSKSI
tara:strand:- start:167 stop:955 length:789 start_codon:yes stop_codon:yes gene_type:complete